MGGFAENRLSSFSFAFPFPFSSFNFVSISLGNGVLTHLVRRRLNQPHFANKVTQKEFSFGSPVAADQI